MSGLVFCRSYYSFGYGVESPAILVSEASGAGFGACVLADSSGLTGQAEFAHEASLAGIRPGHGARLEPCGRSFVFVALEGGWPDLCRMVTACRMPSRVSLAEAFERAGRLAGVAFGVDDARWLSGNGFAGRLHLAVLPERISGVAVGEAEQRAVDAGMEPLAFAPVVFASPGSPERHRMIRAGALHCAAARLPRGSLASPSAAMPAPGGSDAVFAGSPRAVSGALRLAEELGAIPAPLPASADPGGDFEKLEGMALEALPRLYPAGGAALERTALELEAIRTAGLAGYFLEFAEVIGYCRREGIAATARGSAAGSILSYLLGISAVCPLRHGLSFSRFFNRLRPDPPDIDLDIDSERRDAVMNEVLARRGCRAGFVGAVVCHRKRSAFRLAAEAWGLSPSDTDFLAAMLSDPSGAAWRREPARSIREAAKAVEGVPSHIAPHPCGLVISPGPLHEAVSLEEGAQGQPLVQFDGDAVEGFGLLKMDLLGQRGLTVISRVAACTGAPVLVPGRAAKAAAIELMDRGDTLGVVHVESPAMRGLLREMRIRTLDDVARALALVRPGASGGGGRAKYLSAIRGVSPAGYALPQLREPLRDSFGILLYEEDVSEAAMALFGLDEAEGDLMRKMLRRKKITESDILAMARRAGFAEGDAAKAVEVLAGFQGYGFCRSHAYAYAVVSCESAALKAAFPAEFMAGVLAGGGGFYAPVVYIEEARRLGLRLYPPGVNSGEWSARPFAGGVMPGFSCVRGMGPAEFDRLAAGRPYSAPSGVLAAGCGRQVAEAMALAGCFEELGISRSQALWGLDCGDGGLLGGAAPLPDLPDHGLEEKVIFEIRYLGLALSACPLDLAERPSGTVEIAGMRGGPCRIWGQSLTARKLEGGSGFLMLYDGTGFVDAFLPPGPFRSARVISRRPGATLRLSVIPEPGGRWRAVSVEAGPLTPFPPEL
jgi:DNA polymerase III alpha subunit